MKNAIREYIDLSNDEKTKLWDTATFVFDTNVFLNLYRYSKKTREILLKALRELGDRIWMPHQVAYELMRDRIGIIHESNSRYDTLLRDFVDTCKEKLRINQNDPELEQLKEMVQDWLEGHRRNNIVVTKSSEDCILDELLDLFDGKTGKEYDPTTSDRIKKEGKDRYSSKIPPGYKDASKAKNSTDNNSYGDLFVWKQILDFARQESRSIIFVTHDQKEDWWERLNGKTIGPRVELRKEFYRETGGSLQFHMYTMDGFISRIINNQDHMVIDEVKSYNEEQTRIALTNAARNLVQTIIEKQGRLTTQQLQAQTLEQAQIVIRKKQIENELLSCQHLAQSFGPSEMIRKREEELNYELLLLNQRYEEICGDRLISE